MARLFSLLFPITLEDVGRALWAVPNVLIAIGILGLSFVLWVGGIWHLFLPVEMTVMTLVFFKWMAFVSACLLTIGLLTNEVVRA